MSNVQLYLSIGIPTFTVILALLISLFQNNRLSDKMDRIAEVLSAKMDRLTEQQHKDAMSLQGYMIPLHERMARLENSN